MIVFLLKGNLNSFPMVMVPFRSLKGLIIMLELDLPNTYLGSNFFNVSDLTPFFTGVSNSWMNSLQPQEHDETLSDRAPTKLAQPSKRMTKNMTQDPRQGQA